jgi:hypothetical protein
VSGERALPEQPSLRHLKLEAKRRLAAGEFSTLHGSQLAIAREHGQPSWTALKAAVDARGPADGRAVEQLRWIAARFGDAAEHGWTAPGVRELREHFTDEFLSHVTPERLIAIFTAAPNELREELAVIARRASTSGRSCRPGAGCGCGRRWRGIDLIRSNLERLTQEVPCRFPHG